MNPEWREDAACKVHPEINWFPERGQGAKAAKAVCAECVVIKECLAEAVRFPTEIGIRGGTSERQRRLMRTEALADARARARLR